MAAYGPKSFGADETGKSNKIHFIFMVKRSSQFFVAGLEAWVNALGMSADITSLPSLASIVAERNMLSRDAMGLAESSLLCHSLGHE
jgi:hypothetical protein